MVALLKWQQKYHNFEWNALFEKFDFFSPMSKKECLVVLDRNEKKKDFNSQLTASKGQFRVYRLLIHIFPNQSIYIY